MQQMQKRATDGWTQIDERRLLLPLLHWIGLTASLRARRELAQKWVVALLAIGTHLLLLLLSSDENRPTSRCRCEIGARLLRDFVRLSLRARARARAYNKTSARKRAKWIVISACFYALSSTSISHCVVVAS